MSDEGEFKKRLNEFRLGLRARALHYDVSIPDIVYDLVDEARKDFVDKAKTINDCELFPTCWGKVVRLDDVLKWFGSK